MSLVLAIETNASQADTLRQIGRDLDGVELIVVLSGPAAVAAINLETPDLVLLGRDLPPREHDEVIAHLKSLSDGGTTQTLAIPTLHGGDNSASQEGKSADGCEPTVFAEQIAAALGKRVSGPPPELDPLPVDLSADGSPTDADVSFELLMEHFGTNPLALDEFGSHEIAGSGPAHPGQQDTGDDKATLDLSEMLPKNEAIIDPAVHAAEIALIQAQADRRLEAELERVQTEAAEEHAAELTRHQAEAVALREVAVNEARAAAEAEARESLAAQIARVRSEAEQTLAGELARLRAEAVKALADELGRTRAEADQALDAQLAIVKAETDSMRSEAVQEAQNAAERIAARALEDEIAVVRARTEARLQAELERVRQEAERAQAAAAAKVEVETAMDPPSRGWTIPSDTGAGSTEVWADVESQEPRRTTTEQGRAAAKRVPRGDQASTPLSIFESNTVPALVVVTPDEPDAGSQSLLPQGVARWKLAAVFLLVLVTSGVLRFTSVLDRLGLTQGRTSKTTQSKPIATIPAPAEAAPAESARPLTQTGDLSVESTPAGARVIVDGLDRGQTPLKISGLRAGNHSIVLESSAGSVKRSIVVRPGEEASVREQIIPGTLAVFSRLPLELYADGRRIGSTDDGQLLLAPGSYRIGLVNERFNFRGEEPLEIQPGKVTSHTVSLPVGRLHVNTTPGVEVWVDGERQGLAPVGPLAVPIGTREVLVKHPQLGEQRQGVEVKHDQQAEATLLFDRPPDPRLLYPLPSLSTPGPRIR